MLNLEVRSALTPDQAAARIKQYLLGEFGLSLALDEADHLSMEGGGGYVHVTLAPDAAGTRVELVTQEWEQQVRHLAEALGG